MLSSHVRFEAPALVLGGHASAQDPNHILFGLHVDHHHDASSDATDSDEALLFYRMLLIVDLQVLLTTPEEPGRLIERNAVLPAVGFVLPRILDGVAKAMVEVP
jgi:hypothetical protein